MAPGLVIQHARMPVRNKALVRCDITGIIGFVPKSKWPANASSGDFIEFVLRRTSDLFEHPDKDLFDQASLTAVEAFFVNGGDTAHLFGVCVETMEALKNPASVEETLGPLLDRLRVEEEIGLLIVPAAAYMTCSLNRLGAVKAEAESLYNVLLCHCKEMTNRFLIMDAPAGLHGEPLIRWVDSFRQHDRDNRSFGAIYYPWLHSGDSVFPPSGVIAGSFAKSEIEHGDFGVVWPPANNPLKGLTHLEVELTWDEVNEFSERAINPIVAQPGRGAIAFGARTLSIDPNFVHINSRRVLNMIVEQLRRDTAWAVFENNNPYLWSVLVRDVSFRLRQCYGAGLLTGKGSMGDYNVKCNSETNPMALRNAGQVNVEVTMQPVGTVEQIVVALRVGGEISIGGM